MALMQEAVDRNTSPSYARAVTKHVACLPPPRTGLATSLTTRHQKSTVDNNVQPVNVATTPTVVMRHTRKLAAEVTRPRDIEQRLVHREAESSSVGDNDNDNDFQLPARIVWNKKRRENRRQRVIMGNKTSSNACFVGAPEAGRDIFIFRVHRDTEKSAIEELVRSGFDCVSNSEAKSFDSACDSICI